MEIPEKPADGESESLDLNIIRTKWFNEHEKQVLTTQNQLEQLVKNIFSPIVFPTILLDHSSNSILNRSKQTIQFS